MPRTALSSAQEATRPARTRATDDQQPADSPSPDPATVRRARIATAAVVMLVVAVTAIFSLPSRVHLPRSWQTSFSSVQSLVPQGWGFFTRNPREAAVIPYVHNGTEWVNANRGPNAQLRYLLGLNRESRLTEFDLTQVMHNATTVLTWTPCAEPEIDSCVASATAAGVVPVVTYGYQLRLCGDVLIIRQEPIPLAYAGLGYRPPMEAIRFHVTCQEPA